MLYQDTGYILFRGMTDNAVIIFSFVIQPCFDAAGVQPHFLQQTDFNVRKSISFAVLFAKCGNPCFRAEQRMIFGHIKMQAEQKIRIDACGIITSFFQCQVFVSGSCQVNGNALVLFQFRLHRFGNDERHLLFGVFFVFRPKIFPTMSRVYDNDDIFVLFSRCVTHIRVPIFCFSIFRRGNGGSLFACINSQNPFPGKNASGQYQNGNHSHCEKE